jgi:hypothetical protein
VRYILTEDVVTLSSSQIALLVSRLPFVCTSIWPRIFNLYSPTANLKYIEAKNQLKMGDQEEKGCLISWYSLVCDRFVGKTKKETEL